MKLTPDQWAAVEKSLSFPHGRAELLCDGTTKVVAEVRQTKPLRFEVMVFIDGFWRGEWLRPEPSRNEHRFLNMHQRAMYSAKDLALAKRVYSAKQHRQMAEKKYSYYSPTFPTGKAFRRRISSTCQDIRLVDCTEVAVAMLEMKRKALMDELDGCTQKEPS
ncbi:hypothetical protein [Pseudaquabacterium pictum]|uniref:Uncharacterized protein n=1 Tax=Pseudaquabacterium pictum TaxID=2315236 RepID=A0A480ASE9_9BURK|nr:hypothetical protein [Rubrivivax pictus]GCL64343.1 hypothetical protein AQPW35_34240 [Rubrivivax pictus]